MSRLHVCVLCAALAAACSDAGDPARSWTRLLGTSGPDSAHAVATDGAGNVFVAGFTSGVLLGPEFGTGDLFVAKLDPTGRTSWIRQLGAAGNLPFSAATDPDGNVLVAGTTFGAIEGYPVSGSVDAFVVKLDGAGTLLWTRQFGTALDDGGRSVATDAAGNVIVAGWTEGVMDGTVAAGAYDLFVAKFDAAGTRLWTRQDGTSALDAATGVATDVDDNVLVVGRTDDALGGEVSAGGTDAFVQKYDGAGTKLWTRQLGAPQYDEAMAVATDAAGAVFVAGRGALDGFVSAGQTDAFVVKYDGAGTRLWARQFGTSTVDIPTGVATGHDGSVHVAGWTDGALDGSVLAGDHDLFVAKWDGAGTPLWTRQLGTAMRDEATSIVTDAAGNVFVVGSTAGALDGGAPAGGTDAFVTSYDASGRKR